MSTIYNDPWRVKLTLSEHCRRWGMVRPWISHRKTARYKEDDRLIWWTCQRWWRWRMVRFRHTSRFRAKIKSEPACGRDGAAACSSSHGNEYVKESVREGKYKNKMMYKQIQIFFIFFIRKNTKISNNGRNFIEQFKTERNAIFLKKNIEKEKIVHYVLLRFIFHRIII